MLYNLPFLIKNMAHLFKQILILMPWDFQNELRVSILRLPQEKKLSKNNPQLYKGIRFIKSHQFQILKEIRLKIQQLKNCQKAQNCSKMHTK